MFPYLASKLPVAVVTKKDSRLDQGEEGQGIFFLVSYLWPGVSGHAQLTSAISNSQGTTKKFEIAKVRNIQLVWKMQGLYKIL